MVDRVAADIPESDSNRDVIVTELDVTSERRIQHRSTGIPGIKINPVIGATIVGDVSRLSQKF
jgi:hypothetical protein